VCRVSSFGGSLCCSVGSKHSRPLAGKQGRATRAGSNPASLAPLVLLRGAGRAHYDWLAAAEKPQGFGRSRAAHQWQLQECASALRSVLNASSADPCAAGGEQYVLPALWRPAPSRHRRMPWIRPRSSRTLVDSLPTLDWSSVPTMAAYALTRCASHLGRRTVWHTHTGEQLLVILSIHQCAGAATRHLAPGEGLARCVVRTREES
jgi:hypothetical protein